jgi:small subunit ribosomal protein S1
MAAFATGERVMGEQDDDFRRMLEESFQAERFEEGQTVRGTVVALRADVAFVDIGGKGEATIDIEELRDDEGDLEVEVGDRIEAVVVGTAGGLRLSRRLARGAATLRQLEDAFRASLPVEGKVQRAIKGGFEVRIGGQRAFCPVSQIDISRDTDPSTHEGRVYAFRILEFKDGGKNLVVSRRALQEEEQREVAEEVRRGVVAGAVLRGRVASVREFGAFVDLGGGVQGLLHVSEMGWSRISDPSAIVKQGDEITVKVLRVDAEKGRISLGLKQLEEDPWTKVAERYAPGQVVSGRVTRHAEFGAFVELEPGIEALAHVSTFPPTGRADGWKAAVPVESTGAFEVLSVDAEKQRIGVASVPEGSVRAGAASRVEIVPGARLTGKVERHERFGVFVFLAPGRTGLIPLSETGVAREGDVARSFPVGAEVEVVVLEVDEPGRRIRLSRKAVLEAAEKAEVREYSEREDARPTGGFGSLADKLRDALKK